MVIENNRDGYPLRNWWDIADALARQSFQVRREKLCGTAFIVSMAIEKHSSYRHYCFATAWHVIDDVLVDNRFVLFRFRDKLAIDVDTEEITVARLGPPEFDLGLVFLRSVDDLLHVNEMMPLRLKTAPSLGENLGWYGYPGSLEHEPMFCRGTLACFKTDQHSYLINGIAYPGMSGGAVADQYGWVVGVVSEWWVDGSLPHIPGMLQAAPSMMIRHVLEDRMWARAIDTRPPTIRSS
jgi:Trypsin-like peptidase domain